MKDRISTKILENGAIRYGIYDEAGNLLRYEYIRPEDEPTQVGAAWSKGNVLPDDVADAIGLTGDPQVKDALLQLTYGAYSFKLKVMSGVLPLGQVTIEGLSGIDGGLCITDSSGEAIGLSNVPDPAISITNCIDLVPYTSVLSSSGGLTPVNINLIEKTEKHAAVLSTKSLIFSRAVTCNLHLVGGGSNATIGNANTGGTGGLSGRSFLTTANAQAAIPYLCEIGAIGGNSSFLGKSSTSGTQNLGGAGGTGNNAGSPGTGGGTSPIHSSYRFGGSGGGGGGHSEYGMTGGVGSNGGGQGGKGESISGWGGPATEGSNANTARPGAGGGGGGGQSSGRTSLAGGKGVSGAVYFSWEYI